MSKKRQPRRQGTLDTEVINEINEQMRKKQEMEGERKKRKLIFWSIAIFGVVVISAIVGAFLLLLGLVEW